MLIRTEWWVPIYTHYIDDNLPAKHLCSWYFQLNKSWKCSLPWNFPTYIWIFYWIFHFDKLDNSTCGPSCVLHKFFDSRKNYLSSIVFRDWISDSMECSFSAGFCHRLLELQVICINCNTSYLTRYYIYKCYRSFSVTIYRRHHSLP